MEKTGDGLKLPGRVPASSGSKSLAEPSGSGRPMYTGGAPHTSHVSATDDHGLYKGRKLRLLFDLEQREEEPAVGSSARAEAEREWLAACEEAMRSEDVESAMSGTDDSTASRPESRGSQGGRKRPRHKKADSELSSSSSSCEENRPAPKVRSSKSGRGRATPALVRDKMGRFLKKTDASDKTPIGEDHPRSGSGGEGVIRLIPKLTDAPKGRGRPPTTGQYVGLAKAKAALVAAEREALELQAEKEVAEAARKSYELRPRRLSDSSTEEGPTAGDLREQVLKQVDLINQVAGKSSNLKGTFIRTLKEAAVTIKDAVEELSKSSVSAETKRLAFDNKRLKAEVAELRGEMATLRADLRRSQQDQQVATTMTPPLTSAPFEPEALQRSIIEAVGTMVNARFEALEDRLLPERRLRPPLASDRAYSDVTRTQPVPAAALRAAPRANTRTKTPAAPVPLVAADAPELSPPTAPQNGNRGKRKGKSKKRAAPSNTAQETARNVPQANSEEWTKVTRRKAKTTAGPLPASQSAKRPAKKKKPPKLRSPTTSAVALKLQPDAVERGITYARILLQAKKAVDLGSLGIQSLGFKKAATGARLLVLPGATSGETANLLAEKLKQALKEEDVRVSRPEKCASLRISGLDDSVGQFEAMDVLSRVGECPLSSLKVGEVRRDKSGLGTLLVRCPIGAAKKIMGADRLLIGWSTVHRQLLEPRQMRCFRCLNLGHVREQCTAEADHGSTCFRCGVTGHKSEGCHAAPHCLVCAAAKQPAGHKMGGRACGAKPAKRRGKARKAAAGTKVQSQPARPAAAGEAAVEIPMATG